MNNLQGSAKDDTQLTNKSYAPMLNNGRDWAFNPSYSSVKKEKKWSISNIFRRKKHNDSDSVTSEDDTSTRRFFTRKKKSYSKRKSKKQHGTFDHIVWRRKSTNFPADDYRHCNNSVDKYGTINTIGIESVNRNTSTLNKTTCGSKTSLKAPCDAHIDLEVTTNGCDRGTPRDVTNNLGIKDKAITTNESTSDEDSVSHLKCTNDEYINFKFRHSVNRRSRSSRTERYLKRHIKNSENSFNCTRVPNNINGETVSDSNKYSQHEADTFIVNMFESPQNLSTVPLLNSRTTPSRHKYFAKPRAHSFVSNSYYMPPFTTSNVVNRYGPNKCSCDNSTHCYGQCNTSIKCSQLKTALFSQSRDRSILQANDSIRHSNSLSPPPPPPPPRDAQRTTLSSCNKNKQTSDSQTNITPKTDVQYYSTFNGRSSSDQYLSVKRNRMPQLTSKSVCHQEPHWNDNCYNYLADKKPRSRRPIIIKVNKSNVNNCNMSSPRSQHQNSPVTSYQTCKLEKDTTDRIASSKKECKNFEEALMELEVIYNSLKLGDDELLDRAEEREELMLSQELTAQQYKVNGISSHSISRETLSDSSIYYDDSSKYSGKQKARQLTKSQTINRKGDDMAYRKIHNRSHSNVSGTLPSKSTLSDVSYLLASAALMEPPLALDSSSRCTISNNSKEPDVMLDDVVYRNIKHANSTLKVVDPQPPFGIPLGPITPSANSDYLHSAVEEIHTRSSSSKHPDLVKDDLAFRSLRKDDHRSGTALPPSICDDIRSFIYATYKSSDMKNDTQHYTHKYRIDKNNQCSSDDRENEFNSLANIRDANEMVRQVLNENRQNLVANQSDEKSSTDNNSESTKSNQLSRFTHKINETICNDVKRMTSLDNLLTTLALDINASNSVKPSRSATCSPTVGPDENTSIEQKELCEKLINGELDKSCLMIALDTNHDSSEEVRSTVEIYEHNLSPFKQNKDELIAQFQAINRSNSSTTSSKADLDTVVEVTPLSETGKHNIGTNITADTGEHSFVDVLQFVDNNNHRTECTHFDHSSNNTANILQTIVLPNCAVPLLNDCKFSLNYAHSSSGCSSLADDQHTDPSSSLAPTTTLDSLESLESPKLVLNTTKATTGCLPKLTTADEESNKYLNVSSTFTALNACRSNTCQIEMNYYRRSTSSADGNRPTNSGFVDKHTIWSTDPTVTVVACLYGIACLQQLASLEYVALISIVLAIISFIGSMLL